MGKLYSFMPTNSHSRDKLNYEYGTVKNIHYGDIHTKFSTLFDVGRERVPFVNESEALPAPGSEAYCLEGDLVFADASEDLSDVGKSIEIVRLNGERLLSGQHTILARRNDNTLLVGFGGHLFRSARVRAEIRREAQGTKVYGISPTRLSNIEIAYPINEDEQSKIADCLTSLDDVIAAQAQKVKALKTHKQGLMQQLFPREGQTVPRLRFPEFWGRADWTVVPLGELLDGRPQYGVNAPAVPYSADLPTYLRITDIDEDGRFIREGKASVATELTDDDYLEVGDIALARTGASVGKSYQYRPEDGRLVFAGFLIRIRPDQNKVVPSFLSSFLRTDRYWNWIRSTSARSGQPGVNGSEYSALPVPIPPRHVLSNALTEQQRIGDCLGALDDEIATATDQLNCLRQHKEGLLQQLFPSLEGLS